MRRASTWIAFLSICTLAMSPNLALAADGVPAISDAKPAGTQDLPEDGKRLFYETSESTADLVESYATKLKEGGWTLTRKGASGGKTGGGGEIIANRDGEHLVLKAGGPDGKTFVTLCTWPQRPMNDYCS